MSAIRSKKATSTMQTGDETSLRMGLSLLQKVRVGRCDARAVAQNPPEAARAGDSSGQFPTSTVPDAAQLPGLVPIGAPDVLNRTTPVWSEQKARLPVTSTADGFALTSKALRAPFEGVLPAAWKV